MDLVDSNHQASQKGVVSPHIDHDVKQSSLQSEPDADSVKC